MATSYCDIAFGRARDSFFIGCVILAQLEKRTKFKQRFIDKQKN